MAPTDRTRAPTNDLVVFGFCELWGLAFGFPPVDDLYHGTPVSAHMVTFMGLGGVFAIFGPTWPLVKTKFPRRWSASFVRTASDFKYWLLALVLLAAVSLVDRLATPQPVAFTESRSTQALPTDSSRLDVWKMDPVVPPDKKTLFINMFITNNGKAVISQFQHLGTVTILPAAQQPAADIIIGIFAMFHAQLALPTNVPEMEIYPGQNDRWFSVQGPPVDDQVLSAINDGTNAPYVLNLMKYTDPTLPAGKFIFTETCDYFIKQVAHLCESGHNKSYVADR